MAAKRKDRPGRHPAITAELQRKIIKHVSQGSYFVIAAEAEGVSRNTAKEWLAKGTRADAVEPYKSFALAVRKAQAKAEARDVALITKAGQLDWKALAWKLERKFPKKWGKQVRHLFEQEMEAVFAKLEKGLSPVEFQRVLAVLDDEEDSSE